VPSSPDTIKSPRVIVTPSGEGSKVSDARVPSPEVENTANNNFANGHLFYFGRLYYPSYYVHTNNSSIGG